MAITVPTPPYKVPVVDSTGLMNPMWIAWYRQLFLRIGGTIALDNTELADLLNVDLTGALANIVTLQSQVSQIQTDLSGLNQGPNL